MKNTKAKALAHGAVCTALTVLLMVLTLYVPIFSLISVVLVGIPLLFLGFKHGMKIMAVSAAASVLVMFFVTGDLISAILLGVLHLLPGGAIGIAIRKKASYFGTITVAGAGVLVGLLLQLMIVNYAGGQSNGFETLMQTTMETSRQMMHAVLEQSAVLPTEQLTEVLLQMDQALELVQETLMLCFPAILIGMAGVLGYATLAMGIFMLRRLRAAKIAYLPFHELYASRMVCYLSMILSMVVAFSESTSLAMSALYNVALLTDFYLGICGLAVIDHKLASKISSGYVRFIIYAAVFLAGYLFIGIIGQILILLGMIDGLFGIRHIYKVGGDHGEKK